MNYYLRATRELTYAETTLGEWTTRLWGQMPDDKGRMQGKPQALAANQARWMGRRLAAQWQCQVEAFGIEGGKEETVACWRYNAEIEAVETVQEWATEPAGAGV